MKKIALLITLFLFSLPPLVQSQDNCNCPSGSVLGYNLVVNSDFEYGDEEFNSDLPMVEGCAVESYLVERDAIEKCALWNSGVFDHTFGFGFGQYLIVDGFDAATSNARVWYQNVDVVANINYTFEFFWRPTLHEANTANTTLNAVVNGTIIGSTQVSNATDWNLVCFNWIATTTGTVEISIDQADNFVANGADYGIDDISFRGCSEALSCICPAGQTSSTNLIANGDFSAGNTGFTSGLPLQTEDCEIEAYWVGHQITDKCTGWPANVFDHTTGDITGSFMIIDGWWPTVNSTQTVWSQVVNVTAGTYYEFEFWWLPKFVSNNVQIPDLAVTVDGVDLSGLIPSVNSTQWQQYCYGWVAPSTGTVEFSILQVGFIFLGSGYDYGIDDISLRACEDLSQTCQVNAEFEYSLNTENCEVSFVDISDGLGNSTIVGHNWSFGDGQFSTEQNPTHFYNTPATSYLVCLTVYSVNELGICCTDTYCNVVQVPCETASCKVEIHGIFTKGSPQDCSLQFIPSFSHNLPLVGIIWNFGDGTTSSEEYPFHTFPDGGDYEVCLTIVSAGGAKCCSDKHCITIELECKDVNDGDHGGDGGDHGGDDSGGDISGPQCIVHSSLYYTQDPKSCEVSFQNWSSAGFGTTILGYHWTFGDGYSSDEYAPTHYYAGPGFYLACLTVYGVTNDGKCCSDTQCYNVYNFCPTWNCYVNVYNLHYKSSLTDCTLNITTDVISNRPIAGYYWDFGDGTTGTGTNPQHTFPNSGTYNVCVTVVAQDGNGCCSDTRCETMTVYCDKMSPRLAEEDVISITPTTVSKKLELFPNPTSAEFNVIFETKAVEDFDLNIINLQGQVLAQQRGTSNLGSTKLNLDANHLAPGTYFVQLIIENQILTEKLIVQ